MLSNTLPLADQYHNAVKSPTIGSAKMEQAIRVLSEKKTQQTG